MGSKVSFAFFEIEYKLEQTYMQSEVQTVQEKIMYSIDENGDNYKQQFWKG